MIRLKAVCKSQLLSSSIVRNAGTRALSMVAPRSKVTLDISGHYIHLSDAKSLKLYNESISNFLTHDNDPAPNLRLILENNRSDGMTNSLLAFQLIRQPRVSINAENNELEECLLTLEESLMEGRLSTREKFFAAAAAQFAEGNYRNSAALLESCIIGTHGDIMALKLAQDCYMLAGDNKNSLGCIARWLHLFEDRNPMYGHMMGLFACGLVEVGRLTDAEEIASRAVIRTLGKDLWALHAQLNAYQLLGRSSEVIATVEEHLRKSVDCEVGKQLLMFNKGTALLQRGNYTGALRVHDDMVYCMASSDNKDAQLASSVANATLLLWQIGLQSPSFAVEERWTFPDSVSRMWATGLMQKKVSSDSVSGGSRNGGSNSNSDNGGDGDSNSDSGSHSTSDRGIIKGSRLSAMHKLCRSMAISSAAHSDISIRTSGYDELPEESVQAVYSEETSIQAVSKYVIESQSPIIANFEAKSKRLWEWWRELHNQNKQPFSSETEVEFSVRSKFDHQASLERLIQSLAETDEPDSIASICPELLKIQPISTVSRRIPEAPGPETSDRLWASQSLGLPLAEAVMSFSKYDFNAASDGFKDCDHSYLISRLGGTSGERDIVEQTYIESLLRCGRFQEAQILLCERTALVPNEAQSWRRLASIYGHSGDSAKAERAHYTSWQLGIGQGGFGGPQ